MKRQDPLNYLLCDCSSEGINVYSVWIVGRTEENLSFDSGIISVSFPPVCMEKLTNALYFSWSEAATVSPAAGLPLTGFHCCQKLIRNSSQTHTAAQTDVTYHVGKHVYRRSTLEEQSRLRRSCGDFEVIESWKEKCTLHVFSAGRIALVQPTVCLCRQLLIDL